MSDSYEQYVPEGYYVVEDADGEGPGQPSLTVLNPSPLLEASVGTEIWGGADAIMVGRETVWADRVGYGSIRLRDRK